MLQNRKWNRLRDFDYSNPRLYFVTACVHDRVCSFGEVVNEQMVLNTYGNIAHDQWLWLHQQYYYVTLHSFVIMPNHMHGIIEIDTDVFGRTGHDLDPAGKDGFTGTGQDLSIQQKIKSLSELMGAYKTTTSKQIHLAGLHDFRWHRSFHDHIIRNETSYTNISNYIENNPRKWAEDKFHC